MRAGRLRHRVTLQRAVETQDAIGQAIETWGTLATVWAAVEPSTVREYRGSGEFKGEVTHQVTIRSYAGLKPTDRVLFGTRVLQLAGPPSNKDERGIEMLLLCKETV